MIIKTNVFEGYYFQFKVSSKAYEKPDDIYNKSILKKIRKTYEINVYDIHVHLCVCICVLLSKESRGLVLPLIFFSHLWGV